VNQVQARFVNKAPISEPGVFTTSQEVVRDRMGGGTFHSTTLIGFLDKVASPFRLCYLSHGGENLAALFSPLGDEGGGDGQHWFRALAPPGGPSLT